MKNILLTGGAGFIGSNIALRLISKGYNVRVIDNLSSQIHGINPETTSPLYVSIKDKVDFVLGDITDKEKIEYAIKNQDAIIHLAAETGTGQSMYEIKKYSDVNVGGTALLLDVITKNKNVIKKIIFTSSRAIYGEGRYKCNSHGIVYPEERQNIDMQNGYYDCRCPECGEKVMLMPTKEDSMLHPTSVYGITKLTQEQLIMTVAKSLNIPAVVFRYQNVYGPGQSLSNPYTGILSIFSTIIKNNKNINVFEDGKESRDFVYIDDVVDVTISGIENSKADYNAFNVGAEKPIDVITVAETLRKIYRADIDINISGNFRIGDIRHNYADLKKAKILLDYHPKVSFNVGIERFCKWVNSTSVNVDYYQNSIEELKSKGLFK